MNILKGFLNLNKYKWWKNHRRFITLGIFLGLFSYYLRMPTSNDFKVRDTCARLNSSYQTTGKKAAEILKLKPIKEYNERTIANYYCERYLGIK
tara:strand:+ start:2323 stop:2604 length:282 start_codon:yes stop_codon:yes gene_type:complete